ncbi:MAG TPA: sulfatase, partial [Candidatus Polarisedimenticolia bacterium]|nr:sulfatase [Candidatus Polarisedimenticolia bacterium]
MSPLPRARAAVLLGWLALLAVAALFGALAWRLTPLEGSTLKRARRVESGHIPEDASLVLITVDGLRVNRLGSYGDAPLSPTPHLDRLAAEGFRFEQATTPVPETFPAHCALMTGASPVGRPGLLRPGATLPADTATLAEILRASGYQTAAFVGTAAVGRATGLARGFDRFDEPRAGDRPATVRWLAERPAEDVLDAARAWLDDHFRSRFFLWVQLADPAPPHPPDPPRTLRHREPYDAEVESVDAGIGRLLQRLASLGVAGRTIVAVAASHGAGLGEHGEAGSGIGLYDATLRVPILLRVPGLTVRDRSIPEPVRLFDLSPTLLDLLKLAAPRPMEGTSLTALLDPEGTLPPLPARSEAVVASNWLGAPARIAVRASGFKLIRGSALELYDLRRDPGETRNLAAVQNERVGEMKTLWPEGFDGRVGPDGGFGSPSASRDIPPAGTALLEEAFAALRGGEAARAWRALEDLRSLLGRAGDAPVPAGLLALEGGALRLQGQVRPALALYETALGALGPPDQPVMVAAGARTSGAAAIGAGANGDIAPAAGAAPAPSVPEAERADPLRGLVLAEIGACRRLLGDRDGAVEAYREAAAARPDDVDDRLALAEALLDAGRTDQAI